MISSSRILGLVIASTLSLPAYAGGWGFGWRHTGSRHHSCSPIEAAPETVSFVGASFSGEKCLDANAQLSPDNQQILIDYPNFDVFHAGSSSKAGVEKASASCRTRVRLKVPAGYQFAVVSGTGQGIAILSPGASGEVNVRHGFNLLGQLTGSSKLTLNGGNQGINQVYQHSFEMPIKSLNWSSCGGNERDLLIDTTIGVRTKGAGTALMTYTDLDLTTEHEYGLVWRQCQDRTRAVIAVCRAVYQSGSGTAEVQAHAKAKTAAEAIQHAQGRALDRCEDKSNGSACSVPVNFPCQTQSI